MKTSRLSGVAFERRIVFGHPFFKASANVEKSFSCDSPRCKVFPEIFFRHRFPWIRQKTISPFSRSAELNTFAAEILRSTYSMNRILPLFLLCIMSMNVAIPALERIYSKAGLDFFEDLDGKSKTEKEESKEGKEKEKEKESFIHTPSADDHCHFFDSRRLAKRFRATDERFVSELFAAMPERPPSV